MKLGLFLFVQTVFARLLALNLALQVLNVQIFLHLRFVLLALQLSHLLRVFVLFAREVILKLFISCSRLLNLLSKHAFLVFELLVSIRLVHLVFDDAREIENSQVILHFFDRLLGSLDQLGLMLAHLQLVAFDGRLLLQLSAQLLSAVLELLRNSL